MTSEEFFSKIKEFNEIYKIQNNENPKLLEVERLENFKNILSEEVSEVDEIIAKYKELLNNKNDLEKEEKLELLTHISDWLGDIIVYSASEARRFGVDINQILKIIMESNFSKLGADGKPIYDDRGKIMKGPNYWKPEPKIKEFLEKSLS